MMWLIGVGPFLLVHLPIMLLAASIGVWLFYVQHQFEDTLWGAATSGTCTRRRCTAARTTTCRSSCAGSPPISACITSIICAAGFRFIGCRGAARPSGARQHRPAHARREFSLRAPGAVGRSGAPADQFPRTANAAGERRRIDRRRERSRVNDRCAAELRRPACRGTPAPASIDGSQCRRSRSCWPFPCAAAAPSRRDPCL